MRHTVLKRKSTAWQWAVPAPPTRYTERLTATAVSDTIWQWAPPSMTAAEASLPLVARATAHGNRIAVAGTEGTFRYRDLLETSAAVAVRLLDGAEDLLEARVAFLVTPGFTYVAVQWGIWKAGGVAVPLGVSHPAGELTHTLEDSGATVVVATPELAGRLRPVAEERGLRFLLTTNLVAGGDTSEEATLPVLTPDRRAMIIYTSGTTSRPKGVVSTHGSIRAQVTTLVEAWEWRQTDHILLVLPLHHVHGIINVLGCALWSGIR